MNQINARLMLFWMVILTIGVGLFIYRLDIKQQNHTQIVPPIQVVSPHQPEDRSQKLQTAITRIQNSLVSIHVLPNEASKKGGKQEDINVDGVAKHLGTGIISGPDGLILTVAAVVDGRNRIQIKTQDKREFSGRVLALDEPSGLVLIRTEAEGLESAPLSDTNKAKIGDTVFLLSLVEDANLALKEGIISGSPIPVEGDPGTSFIQTDLSVSEAWSGGALFNAEGEVIGINLPQTSSDRDKFIGRSLSIPSHIAKSIQSELMDHGVIQRGKLGVLVQPLNPILSKALKGPDGLNGALVTWVDEAGPGGEAGLMAGDILVKINEHDIQGAEDVPRIISNMRPGTQVSIALSRRGQAIHLDASLGAQDTSTQLKPIDEPQDYSNNHELGLLLEPIPTATLNKIGLNAGLRVKSVQSAGKAAGILTKDIILSINGQPMRNQEDFGKIVGDPMEDYAVQIFRDGRVFILAIHLNRNS